MKKGNRRKLKKALDKWRSLSDFDRNQIIQNNRREQAFCWRLGKGCRNMHRRAKAAADLLEAAGAG